MSSISQAKSHQSSARQREHFHRKTRGGRRVRKPDSICHAAASSSTYLDSPVRRCLRVLQPAAHTWHHNYHNICPTVLGDNARVPMKRLLGLLIIVPSAPILMIPMLPESCISIDSPLQTASSCFEAHPPVTAQRASGLLGAAKGDRAARFCAWGCPFPRCVIGAAT